MKNIIENYRYQVLFCLNTLFILFAIGIVFSHPPYIGSDSGYYLSLAREMYNGKIYFVEIGTIYNPLGVLVMGIPFIFSTMPDGRYFILINIFIYIGSSGLVYRIFKSLNKHRWQNLFFSSVFFLGTLLLDGFDLMLEPLSVFFQLLAIYLYLTYRKDNNYLKLLFAGIAISLSFFSKQYGLFVLLPISLDILLNKNFIIKKASILAAGFLIPIIVCIAYLNSNGASIAESFYYFIGKGIKLDNGNGTGVGYELKHVLSNGFFFLKILPFFIVAPYLLFKFRKKIVRADAFYFVLFLSSLLVLINAPYAHYFQYILPYALILYVFLLKASEKDYWIFEIITYASTFRLAIVFLSYLSTTYQYKVTSHQKSQQILNQYIPPHSQVFLSGVDASYYYLCRFNSIQLQRIAFNGGNFFSPSTIVNAMPKKSFLVVSEENFPSYKEYLHYFLSNKVKLQNKVLYILKRN